ncbi:hypothetical protein AB6735_18570 [Mucilaginibacter sp. RCC_168]|uniref:hypothetical protein n=1 Tax=Mucilaginibacter sp. RCC_168 TaxID=3239221 RepID=UPI0035231E6E
MHLFEKVINPAQPEDVAESLLKDIMFSVFKKLRNKTEARIKGKGYSLPLTDPEAKAYYLYFQNRHLGKDWHYEQIFIEQHLLQLNKTYA